MKRELIYVAAVGGCVGAMMTVALGLVVPLGAQSESDGYFDEITCRSLRVAHEEEGLSETEITPRGVMVRFDDRVGAVLNLAGVRVDSRKDEEGAWLGPDGLTVYGNERRGIMSSSLITVRDEDMRGVELSIDEHGGAVSVFGRESFGECALMSVNEYGNGAVSTFDKNGHGLGSLK